MTNIFGVFAHLLICVTQLKIHNYPDSSRTYERLLENPKTWNSRELLRLPENLLHSKFGKMVEKLNVMVFRAVFLFEVHMQQSYWKKKINN